MSNENERERGFRWWLRHVIVPLIGGGGIVAIIVAILTNSTNSPPSTPIQVVTSSPARQNEVFLSKQVEIFDFDDGNTSGWRPFEWDTGWIVFEKSGNIEIVGKDLILDGHKGPFLKYPLDLESEEQYAYLNRNAIYKPVDERVIGIFANIFYESDEEYRFEEIYAGFVVPYKVGEQEFMNEDYMKKLVPGRWNTIVWSLYSPVWWGSEDKDEEWNEFKGLFGDGGAHMHPGRRLDHLKINSIGIQFFLFTDDGPKQFKGTAYIDNIGLIYQRVP